MKWINKKSDCKVKQESEINVSKRLIDKIKNKYPRLSIRIIANSLYPSKPLIEKCEKKL